MVPFRPRSETNIDGTCARGVTESIIQTHSTGRKLVATTSTSTAVTKSHIIRGRETVSVRSVKASGTAVIDGARASAYVLRSDAAIDNHSVLGDSFGDGFTNKGEVGLCGRDPFKDFVLGDLSVIFA